MASEATAPNVQLDGQSLGVATLMKIASGGQVSCEGEAMTRMATSNRVLLEAIARGEGVYGVTTGLGPKVTQRLSASEISAFSIGTIRGRAHAIGPCLPRTTVRAAMAIRLNTFLVGAIGVSPDVAEHIRRCLNADLVPIVGATTSVGPADLMWGGSFARALIGEGRFLGHDQDAASVLEGAGIAALQLGPRDGLGLVSHTAFATAIAATGLFKARRAWECFQMTAALSLEAFRANLSPFQADALALVGQAGAAEAGGDVLSRLEGSMLFDANEARRLQDPLSFRNIAQVHGAAMAALGSLEDCVLREINGSPDSPVILPGTLEIVSTGNFLNPHLTTTLVAANYALTQVASLAVARIARLLAARFTDLPNGLNAAEPGNAGLGPLTKLSEALFSEIVQVSAPPPVYPSPSADGVEDVNNFSALAAQSLTEITTRLASLASIELIVAAQAVELRHVLLGPQMQATLDLVRAHCAPLGQDRSLTDEIEALSAHLRSSPAI